MTKHLDLHALKQIYVSILTFEFKIESGSDKENILLVSPDKNIWTRYYNKEVQ